MPYRSLTPETLRDVRLMLVDGDILSAATIESRMRSIGAEVTHTRCIEDAKRCFDHAPPDLVILDIVLPDGNGLELLRKCRVERQNVPVILVTALCDVDYSVMAPKLGAFDYLQKPIDMNSLISAVCRAAETSKLRQTVGRFRGYTAAPSDTTIVGESATIKSLRLQVARIAASRVDTVLVLGDSGTGKELVSRALHDWSSHKDQPFVEVNCASIPENLLESELFGFERGAFTDARERKLGLFEMARHGTVFLDEIGEMPLKLQGKLLRVLEYRRFKRLGGTKDVEFTGRIVAATNKRLLEETRHGSFRSDLFYRLSSLLIKLPALKERRDDIPLLSDHLLTKLSCTLELKKPLMSAAATSKLLSHDWPGNVRELRNVLQRALVLFTPDVLLPEHVSFELEEHDPETATSASISRSGIPRPYPEPSDDSSPRRFLLPPDGINLEELENDLVTQAMEHAGNNQTRAAQLLGVSRHVLRYRLEKLRSIATIVAGSSNRPKFDPSSYAGHSSLSS